MFGVLVSGHTLKLWSERLDSLRLVCKLRNHSDVHEAHLLGEENLSGVRDEVVHCVGHFIPLGGLPRIVHRQPVCPSQVPADGDTLVQRLVVHIQNRNPTVRRFCGASSGSRESGGP